MNMIDLNLVRVFVTIYETGSVSGAAERLHVTQPSVSYALGRLRDQWGDPLFKRTRDGMQPTVLASQLYGSFRPSLADIERAVALTKKFEPDQSTRRFRLALSDLGEVFFLPHVLRGLQAKAPLVELEVIQIEIERLDEWLKTGKIDAAVCNRSYLPVQAKCELMFEERYVCMARLDHPRVGDTLSMEQFLEERHVVVSAGTGHHFVEDRLREAGVERTVSLRVPHFSVLPEIISTSDLLVTLPERVAKMYIERNRLKTLELPFTVPRFEVSLHWHEHSGDSTAQLWFCQFLKDTISCL
ncbi:LysR family transcriptional regulator [Pseudomonas kermanshahensis]|uniref:LysR family transcriptional regulator n=2 Tax=Pseudomonas TaxID=286 RepID=UPI003B82FE76